MKKWLVQGKWGVVEVEVMAHLDGSGVRVRDDGGQVFDVSSLDLRDTEAEARREHVDREACALEEQADRHDVMRADAEELARSHADDAEWNRVKAAEMRARAKVLRDALAELDAVEGRR